MGSPEPTSAFSCTCQFRPHRTRSIVEKRAQSLAKGYLWSDTREQESKGRSPKAGYCSLFAVRCWVARGAVDGLARMNGRCDCWIKKQNYGGLECANV